MSPVRAPLSTLLGLLLVRWLLSCSQRLLVRLAPAQVAVAEHDPSESVDETPAIVTPLAAAVRRQLTRQRARLDTVKKRYRRWREIDTEKLTRELADTAVALREQLVTGCAAPAAAASSAIPAPSTAGHGTPSPPATDWMAEVRERGTRFIAPTPSASAPLADTLEKTNPDRPGNTNTGGMKKPDQAPDAANLSSTDAIQLQDVSHAAPIDAAPVDVSQTHPGAAPTHAQTLRQRPPATDVSAAPPFLAPTAQTTDSWTGSEQKRPSTERSTRPATRAPSHSTQPDGVWPALPRRQLEEANDVPAPGSSANTATSDPSSLWPALPDEPSEPIPTSTNSVRDLRQLQAEQRGAPWNE